MDLSKVLNFVKRHTGGGDVRRGVLLVVLESKLK